MCGCYVDKNTRNRILFSAHSGDITFQKSGDEAVVTEDLTLMSTGSDWSGNYGPSNTQAQMMYASQENRLQGDDADVESKTKLPNLNVRGIRKGTHRQRVKVEYVRDPNKA